MLKEKCVCQNGAAEFFWPTHHIVRTRRASLFAADPCKNHTISILLVFQKKQK